jgi:hypothetical protein
MQNRAKATLDPQRVLETQAADALAKTEQQQILAFFLLFCMLIRHAFKLYTFTEPG